MNEYSIVALSDVSVRLYRPSESVVTPLVVPFDDAGAGEPHALFVDNDITCDSLAFLRLDRKPDKAEDHCPKNKCPRCGFIGMV